MSANRKSATFIVIAELLKLLKTGSGPSKVLTFSHCNNRYILKCKNISVISVELIKPFSAL